MTSDWKECKLSDICNITSSKRIFAHEYVDSGTPFYRGKEIIEKFNGKQISTELYITNEKFLNIKNKFGVPQNGDILLTSVGTLGIPYLVNNEEFYFKDGNLTWFQNFQNVDNKFLYLWLCSEYAKNQISSKCIGSTQKALTIETLKQFEILLPPLETQRKIAKVLSAIDDKIELNNSINNNLEQQAQAIFKSWFVDFKPFGGVMPKDAQLISMESLCTSVTKGTTPTTLGMSFVDKGVSFLKAESILDNHSFDCSKFSYIDNDTHNKLSRSIMQTNDIVFTIAGTLGRFAIIDDDILPANTNQAVAIIRADHTKVEAEYVYAFFIGNWHKDYYAKRIQQAVQANLNLTTIKSLPIIVLSLNDRQKFLRTIKPIFNAIKNNEKENRSLIQLRDTLLAKLMSGEIDVDKVEV